MRLKSAWGPTTGLVYPTSPLDYAAIGEDEKPLVRTSGTSESYKVDQQLIIGSAIVVIGSDPPT